MEGPRKITTNSNKDSCFYQTVTVCVEFSHRATFCGKKGTKCVFVDCVAEHCFCVSSLQVEELYETYCIQWRLCQGAVNMKRAFSLSPSTRASRESLLELGRNHRHSLQVLRPSDCVFVCVVLLLQSKVFFRSSLRSMVVVNLNVTTTEM